MSIVLIWFQSSKMYSIVFSFFFSVNKLWQIILFQFLVKLLCPLYHLARSYFLPFWLIMKQIHAIFKPTIKCHLKIVTNHAMTIKFFLVHNLLCSQSCPTKVLFFVSLDFSVLGFFFTVFEVQLIICQLFITHYLQFYVTKQNVYIILIWICGREFKIK